jgi:molecular chaperone GrpE
MDEKQEKEPQEEIEITEDENIIEPEIEDIEEQTVKKLKKLQEKLKVCEKEKMTHLEDLQRAKAEFLNGKKRLEEEKTRYVQRAENKLVEKLLPMADSFHMAMHNKDAWEAIDETWRKGVESIHSQLHAILETYGVSEIHPEGDEFNPQLHEAMTNITVNDKKLDNHVITVIQNGFIRKIGDKEELLRPARVTIGEYTEKESN